MLLEEFDETALSCYSSVDLLKESSNLELFFIVWSKKLDTQKVRCIYAILSIKTALSESEDFVKITRSLYKFTDKFWSIAILHSEYFINIRDNGTAILV